ncbi:MAG: hypothetical protein DRI52_07105 [Chloroflexi bacterium]|nr:MAG: hypothetical protein DRI52_07105 [Chloroflexota bacterium]
MGLDIWFREDITNALKAAEQASATTVAAMEYALNGSSPSTTLRRCTEPAEGPVVSDPRYLRAYREGWRAALVTIALAFGLKSDGSEECYGQDKLLR